MGRVAQSVRAGRSGIQSWWGRVFPPVQTGPGAHPASCKIGAGSFPGAKCGQGVLLTIHPLLVPLQLYLYPPSGPHRTCNGVTLYSVSKFVQLESTERIHSLYSSSQDCVQGIETPLSDPWCGTGKKQYK